MRNGLFPGQHDAVRNAVSHARNEGEKQATRRALLVGVLLAPAVGGGGYLLAGRVRSERPRLAEPSENLVWLHALARGPLAELEARQMHLVTAVEQGTIDETLAYGIQRLVVLALTQPGNQVLQARLLQLSRNEHLPAHLESSLELLVARGK